MDRKKVDELLRMQGNCKATTEALTIELLSTIANGVARLVQIEENKLHDQMELDLRSKPTTESKKEFTKKVEEKVEGAIEKVEPVKKVAAPKKKAVPKKVEEPVEVKAEPVPAEPVPVAEKKLPTKEEVMKELVAYIGENGEAALATVLKDLGNFTNFPSVPQEKYEDLLNAIK